MYWMCSMRMPARRLNISVATWPVEPTPDAALESTELQRDIRRLIRTLPRKLRDALLLAGTGEHTYDEIGRILNAPVGTVKWRVAEARRVLKRKLAAMGYHDA